MEKPIPAYKGDEPHILVSYSHEESDAVFPEIQWLKEQGCDIWYDEGISMTAPHTSSTSFRGRAT